MNIRHIIIFVAVFLFIGTAQAKVVAQPVAYTHDGVSQEGYLAFADAVSGKMPGILVVHEWWVLNDYARARAFACGDLVFRQVRNFN